MLTWEDDEQFVVGRTGFRALAPEAFMHSALPKESEFPIFKSRPQVEHYAAILAELQPQRIIELGISMGGSTVFFAELARPRRLVAIDREPLRQVLDRIHAHAAERDYSDVVRTFGGVDQEDRRRLAQIAEDEFEGAPLDLVVDDCSHLYEPTRASFNELFPRLRSGGVYVIEDWVWAHTPIDSEDPEGLFPDEVPLSRLLFEIELAIPAVPGLIAEISIDKRAAVIRRGDTRLDPADFDISSSSNPRGREMLAPT